MSIRKLSSILLTTLILFGATSAFAVDYKTTLTLTVAGASTYDEEYTFTQPENLTITQSGWNSLGSITAKYSGSNSFNPSKKLVVTVSSTNNFALKADGVTDTISYTHATSANDTSATTTFEFSAAEITVAGTSKAVGVIVDDYSSAAAGTYTDEITYSVEVQSATTTTTVTWTADDITGSGNSFTKDGVTVTAGGINFINQSFTGNGTFTTTLGNFTKIEITAYTFSDSFGGEGWSGGTWTGTASNSVSFSDSMAGISKIVFTIDTSAQ